ncbi:MAG: shikimate kinase [Deltaproteobacteria bacterium]|nr:shikimate kinase [Deltaproteobacteria bacterium]
MNIVLIGYRCSGKSVVGKTLAHDLRVELVDTDRVLEERVGSTIPDYVAEKGWESFRMLEKIIIRSVSNYDQQVIATGGGVVLNWDNVRNLKKSGWVVWLQASIPAILERMTQDERSGRTRPGLSGEDPMAEIEQILGQRTALYERACDYAVKTDQQSPEAVAREIIQSMPVQDSENHRRLSVQQH